MPLIEWTEDLRCGVEVIDQQHRQWAHIMNRLHECLMSDSAAGNPGEFVEQIEAFASSHFAEEERLMEAYGYPALAEHRQLHREFVAQVAMLRGHLANGEYVRKTSLMSLMRAWLEKHIRKADWHYAAFQRSVAARMN